MNDQTDDINQPVIDGEIVEDATGKTLNVSETSSDEPNSAVSVILNLENLIKSHISGLATRKNELKNYKEMMSSSFKNDPSYQDAEAAVKEATKLKKDAKAKLMKLPEVKNVQEKVNEFTTEIKEMDGALSDYLREYQRLSGSNEITDDDGIVHEITYVAKLVKKGK